MSDATHPEDSDFTVKAAGSSDDPAARSSGGEAPGGDPLAGNGASDSLDFLDSDFLNDAVRGAEAPSPAPGSDASIVSSLDAMAGGDLQLSDLSFMYEGSFVRQGADLMLVKPDGTAILIENYFAADPPPDIVGDFGRRLSPELVDSFLMPMAPGQTAALSDEQVAQAQGNSIGSVDTLTGEVYAIRPDGTRVLLQAGDPVFQGDQVETADGGSLKISFIDGTIFTLGGDARLALDEMVYDPGTQSGESAFSILKGGFLFVSGQIAENNPNDMQVSTPVATIGIRGTIVTGEVAGLQSADGETFRFTVVDGEIAVSAGNQTIVLSDNFSTVTAQPDPSTGQLRVFDFVDTAENVIARNSNQFRALTSNDLSNIERAIESTIQSKTGATVDIDLRGIVDNVTREQEQENEDSDTDVEEEGPDALDGDPPTEEGDSGTEEGDSAGGEETTETGDDEEVEGEEVVGEGDGEEVEGGGDDTDLTDEDLADLETGDPQAGDGNVGDQSGGDDDGESEDGGDTETENTDVTEGSSGQTVSTPEQGNIPQTNNGDLLSQTPGFGKNNKFTQGGDFEDDDFGLLNGDDGSGGDDSDSGGFDSSFDYGSVDDFGDDDDDDDFGFDDDDDNDGDDAIEQLGEAALDNTNTLDRSSSSTNFDVNLGSSTVSVTVKTGSGNDTIKTGSGNDTVKAGGGNDTIIGGTGNGDDSYDGESGTDTLTYDSVTGTLTANLTMEMNGLLGDSTIEDGSASVIDNDTITGIEEVRLGDGDDIIYVNTAGVNVDGDAGTDTISFSSGTITSDATFSFESGLATRDSNSSFFTNVEAVIGGDGDDSFTVSNLLQSASGGSGTDTLSFADFDDGQTFTISSAGIDIFDVTPQGQSEGEIGINARGADYAGFESLIGTDFDDTIHAQNGILSIDGGDGDDRLVVADSAGTMSVSIGVNGDIQNVETLDLSSLSTSLLTVELTAQDVIDATSDGTLHILGAQDAANNIIRPGSGWEQDASLSSGGNVALTSGGATLILDSNAISAASNGTVTFTGTTDNSWQNSANWSNEFTDDLTPTATDLVVLENTTTLSITFNGENATVGSIVGSTDNGTDSLIISDGTLTVTNGIAITDTVQGGDSGKLVLAADSTAGTLDINGGEVEIDGATLTAGDLLIDGEAQTAGTISGTGTLVSTGTVTFADGHDVEIDAVVDLRDAELVNNIGTNDVTVSSGGRLIIDGDTSYTGENASGIDVTIGSLGVLEIGEDGTVTLNDGNSADFIFADQSTIDLGGTWSNEGSLGAFEGNAATTISGSGTLINTGEITFDSDHFNANLQNYNGETDGAVILDAGSTLTLGGTLSGGTITLGGASKLAGTGSVEDLALLVANSGSVLDLADISVTGTARFFGGTLTGNLNVADGQLDARAAYEVRDNGVLNIGSDTTVSETMFGSIQVGSDGTVAVAAGETAELGIFTGFSQGTSSLEFEGGVLSLNGDAQVSANSSFVGFDSASQTTISGNGELTNAGTLNFNHDNVLVDVTNTGMMSVEGTLTTAFSGGLTNNGTLDVESGATLSNSTASTNNGTLTLSGDLTGVGTLTNSVGGTIESTGGTLSGFVDNLGKIDGSSTVVTVDGSLINRDGAVLDINGGTLSGTGTVEHQGTLTIDENSSAQIGDTSNDGSLALDSRDGTIEIESGGALEIHSTLTLGDDSVLSGDGTLSLQNGSELNIAGGETFTLADSTGQTVGTATVEAPDDLSGSVSQFKPTIQALGNDQILISTVRSGDTTIDLRVLQEDTGSFISGHGVQTNTAGAFAVTQLTDGTFRLVTDIPQSSYNQMYLYSFDSEFSFDNINSIGSRTSSTAAFDDFEILPQSDGGFVVVSQNLSEDEIQVLYFDSNNTVVETVTHSVSSMDTGIDADVFANGDVVVTYAEDNGEAIVRRALFVDGDDQSTNVESLGGSSSNSGVPKAVAVLSATAYVEASIVSGSTGAQVFIRNIPGEGGSAITLPDFDSGTNAESIDVTAMNDGGFAVAWSVDTGTDVDVFVQRYNASGEAVGDKINATVAGDGSQATGASGDQTNVRIDMIGDTEFIVVYESNSNKSQYSKGTFGEVTEGTSQPEMSFSGTVELTGGGVLVNDTDTDITTDLFRVGSDGELRNSGTLTFGSGTLDNEGVLSNSGTFDLQSGTLVNQNSVTNSGTVNITSSGTLENQSNLVNSGTLNVTGSEIDNFAGIFTNTGTVNLTGSNNSQAVLDTGNMTNDGRIQLDEDGSGSGAEIDLYDSSGGSVHRTLTNAGTIAVSNSGGSEIADFAIKGYVVNTGLIDIDHSIEYGYGEGPNGFTLDTRDGDIDIAAGQNLNIRYQNGVIVGSDTNFTGAGTLTLNDDTTVSVASGESFTYDSDGAPTLQFSGIVTFDGDGTFSNATGSTITASNSYDDVTITTASFENDGFLQAKDGGALTIATSDFDNSQGTLNVLGNSISTDLFIAQNMSLDGLIRLDGGTNTLANAEIDTGDNTLTVTGTLLSTTGTASTTANDLDGHFINNGLFDIDQSAVLDGSDDTLDSRNGTIDIATLQTLEIDGSLTVGTDTSLTGNGTLLLDESHLVVADGETFSHSGTAQIHLTDAILEGSGSVTNTGSITFDGGTLASSGTLAVDQFTNYGQITAGSGTLTLATSGFTNDTEGVEGNTGTFELNAGTAGTATVKLDENFQNSGVLELTGTGSLANAVLTQVGSESVVNSAQGTILVTSTGETGDRILDLEIDNQGTLDIGVQTTLTAGHTLDSSSGTIVLGADGTLSVLGELAMGQSSSISTTTGGLIDVQGTLSVAQNDTATNEGSADAITMADGSTLAGLGTFRNTGNLELSGVNLNIAAIDNDGTIRSEGGTLDLGTTTVIDNSGGTISAVSAISRGVLEVSQSATLGGKILLDVESGARGATVSVANGESLTVSGILQADENIQIGQDNVVSEHTISGSIVNTGTFDIDHSTNVFGNLDSTNGDFDIASTKFLNIKNGNTLTVGDDTDLTGDGTLKIKSGAALEVAAGETFAIGTQTTVDFESGTTMEGTGTLAIATGQSQNVDGVTLSLGGVANSGTMTVDAGESVSLNGVTLSGDGELAVSSDDFNAGSVVLTSDSTNAAGHTIALTSTNSTLANAGSITTSNGSTLVNQGTITASEANGTYALAANIANSGAILLSENATLFSGRTLDTSDGTLTVSSGDVLSVDGNLILGADTELDAQLNLGSTGLVSVADGEVFSYDGDGNQGISFASGGTIAGTGTLQNTDTTFDLAGATIAGSAHIDNDGKMRITDGAAVIETANFDNAGGTIFVSADESNAGTLTVNSTMTNAGLLEIELNGGAQGAGGNAILTTTDSGKLHNTGTMTVMNAGVGTPGQLNVEVDIDNTGVIDIRGQTDLDSGRTLDTTDGTLLVSNDDTRQTATEFTINGSTLVVGTDTVFETALEITAGTVAIGSNGVLHLAAGEDFTYGSNAPILSFVNGGTIGGTGEMTVTGTLDLTGATLGAAAVIDNDGDIKIQNGALSLNPGNLDNAGGTLSINSDTTAGALSISTSGTLAGSVILDSVDAGNDDATLTVASGESLTVTGVLLSQDSAGSGLSHEIFGTVVNEGVVSISAELNVNDVLDSKDGDISIATNQTLDLDGTLGLGTDTDLLGSGTIFVDDGAVINIVNDENFTYSAGGASIGFGFGEITSADVEITGGGTFTNQTDLTLSQDITLSISQLVNDGGSIGLLSQGDSLSLAGTTITNQSNGVLQVGTLTGTGQLINDTSMSIDNFNVGGSVSFVNNGTVDTADGTLSLNGASASMTIGTTGTLSESGSASMVIELNDGAAFENQGLVTLSDSSGAALTIENNGSGNGTFANTGTIDFNSSSTEIRVRDGATLSLRAGTTFAGSAGIIALTNGGAIAFDTDFTLPASSFTLDSVSPGGTLGLVTGTGTLTNTGGISDFELLNINVAKFVNQTTVDAGTSTITTSDFVNDSGGTLELSGETLTIDGSLTNNGLFQIGSGVVTGSGDLSNAGRIEVIASVTDVNADLTGLSAFSNSGTLSLRSAGSGDIATMTVGDFVNSGTISFESDDSFDAAVLKMGGSGDGTLTNDGLITNILSRDITVPSDAFTIDGNVTAGTTGGTIHVVDYVTTSAFTDGSLAITGDLTLNDNSTTIIESGSGSIGGILNVQGTLTYAGSFELRVDEGLAFLGSFDAIRSGSAAGTPDRISILDSTGTSDFGLNNAGKLVLPNFDGNGNLEFGFFTPTDILASAGSLIGDTNDELVLGSTGDDIMTTGSDGISRFFGRGGDDSFTLSASADTRYVDGGIGGRDIIYTDDFGIGDTDSWRINNIEALDFSGSGSGTIAMTQEFMFGISEDLNEIINGLGIDSALKDDALVIEGDSGQTLEMDQADWTATGTTVSVDHDNDGSSSSYAIYSASNGAHAFVDTDMQVNLSSTPS